MLTQARTIEIKENRPAIQQADTRRHRAVETLVRLYIRFSRLYAIFIVVTADGVGLVGHSRDPHRAVDGLRVATGGRLELARVWWTQTVTDAATVHLAFAATVWPPDELIPAVLSFAREQEIPLTSDTVVQARARDRVERVDSELECSRISGGMKSFSASFGVEREWPRRLEFPAIPRAVLLRRLKLKALFRIARENISITSR